MFKIRFLYFSLILESVIIYRCGHCKRLAPTWNDLAVKYAEKEEKDVIVAKVDCTIETALCSGMFRKYNKPYIFDICFA